MPRDLVEIHRGTLASMPALAQHEPAYTTDERRVYVGSLNGNLGAVMFDESNIRVDATLRRGVRTANEEIEAKLALASGKVLIIPFGSYEILSTINVPENTIIIAYGVKLYNNTANIPLLSLASGCQVYGLQHEGNGNSLYDVNGSGITINGLDKDNYIENIEIHDCKFDLFSYSGISAKFARGVNVSRTKFKNIGYVGVGCSSVEDFHVDNVLIDEVSPGVGSNAYGVFFTKDNLLDVATNPTSKRCSVKNSTIKNIPIWEGLDTHGGEDIEFINNTIINCKSPIALVNSTGLSASEEFSPKNIKVLGNKLQGIGFGEGVVVEGVDGNPAKNIMIRGNSFLNCGVETQASSGAIEITSYTDNVSVHGNYLKASFSNAIAVTGLLNKGISILGNTIEDVSDVSNSACSGINLAGYQSSGIVKDNLLIDSGEVTNTFVNERGIYGRNDGVNNYLIKDNINQFVTPYQLIDYTNSYVNEENGIKDYNGLVAPEGNVTATIGAKYTNRNGGAGTTFYIKETGVDTNTGWVAK